MITETGIDSGSLGLKSSPWYRPSSTLPTSLWSPCSRGLYFHPDFRFRLRFHFGCREEISRGRQAIAEKHLNSLIANICLTIWKEVERRVRRDFSYIYVHTWHVFNVARGEESHSSNCKFRHFATSTRIFPSFNIKLIIAFPMFEK